MTENAIKWPTKVELYNLLHRGNVGDISFYLQAVEGAESVLELGCGGGRILLPMLEAGHRVTGLDIEPEMLEFVRKKAEETLPELNGNLTLVEGNFLSFDLGRSFDVVLLPFNTLHYLMNDEEVKSCFRSVRAHLPKGGRFLFDIYLIEAHEITDTAEDAPDFLLTVHYDEFRIEIFEHRRCEPETLSCLATYEHIITHLESDEQKRFLYTIPQRYLQRDKVERLLREAGFEIIRHLGSFDGQPVDEESVMLICELRAK